MSRRDRYAPALRVLLDDMDARGLSAPLCARRAADEEVCALAGIGLITSSPIEAGQEVWRLRLTRLGRAVRDLLLAERVRA